MNEILPKTLFMDIDGTLVEHKNPPLPDLFVIKQLINNVIC